MVHLTPSRPLSNRRDHRLREYKDWLWPLFYKHFVMNTAQLGGVGGFHALPLSLCLSLYLPRVTLTLQPASPSPAKLARECYLSWSMLPIYLSLSDLDRHLIICTKDIICITKGILYFTVCTFVKNIQTKYNEEAKLWRIIFAQVSTLSPPLQEECSYPILALSESGRKKRPEGSR